MQADALIRLKGLVWRMELGAADLIEVTVKCAKLSKPVVFELKPEQAKHYEPGMKIEIQLRPEIGV